MNETAEDLARKFHEAYERLAPSFGYKTREASAKPWAEVPEDNRRLMVAVAAEILASKTRPVLRRRTTVVVTLTMKERAAGDAARVVDRVLDNGALQDAVAEYVDDLGPAGVVVESAVVG